MTAAEFLTPADTQGLSSPRRYLARLLLVAALYAVAGRLGLLLAIPPGYATAVWPASGIALAALLIGGRWLWPGVMLGSILVNISTSWDPATPASMLRSLALAAAIGGGAALQAALGAALIQRYGHSRRAPGDEFDVVLLPLLGGPLSCVVNASISVGSLWSAGLVPSANVLFNWWTWWVGDSIGVILFAPLLLVWWPGRAVSRLRQQLLITVPLAILFALVVGLFLFVSRREEALIREQLQHDTAARMEQLAAGLENHLEMLYSLQSFYLSSEEVTRAEFRSFTGRLLQVLPGVQALSWAPLVSDAGRAAYVAAMRRDGADGFDIREADGTSAAVRAQYVAVQFIEPLAGNARALGFDLASDPPRRRALEAARDSGQPTASAALQLVQDPLQRAGVIAVLPLYRHGPPPASVAERRAALQGYVTTVFAVGEVLKAVFDTAGSNPALRYRLVDVTDSAAGQRLYEHGRFERGDTRGLRHSASLDWAGRRWRVDFFLPGEYLVAHRSWQAWGLLAVGLLLTGLLEILLLVLVGRQARVEALAAEQTVQIRREEERFRGLLENAPDAMVIVNDTGIICLANAQVEHLFGYPRSELLGQPIELLVPQRYRDHHRGDRRDYALHASARPMGAGKLLTARRQDGSEFPAEISLGPMRYGDEQYVTATVRDISERVQVQDQLAQYAEHLKRSNEELEQFAYVASHDLKAPLRGVIGFSQLLQRRLGGQLDADTREYLHHIIASSQHMQNLISDLLLFARIGRGDDSAMAPVDCERVLAEVRQRLRGLIDERGVRLSHEPLPRVLGTDMELQQLLQNLISNAIKFQPGAQPRVQLSAQREGDYWRIGVRDDGIGIPPDQQQRIFKIFQRLHSSEHYEGTGIGLSICQKIVQRHGGRIWVESEPGKGATFYFTLRAAPPLPVLAPA